MLHASPVGSNGQDLLSIVCSLRSLRGTACTLLFGKNVLIIHPLQPRKPFARILDRAKLLLPIVSDAVYRVLTGAEAGHAVTVGCWCRNGRLKRVSAEPNEMAEADKDRRSRMAVSTVNAPPKKGGAGGSFTWGSEKDGTMDFDASRLQQPVKVITAAAPVQVQAAAAPFTANLASSQQFPSLGSRPVQAPAAAWGRPLYQTTAAPAVIPAASATSVAPVVQAAAAPQPVTTTRVITGMAPAAYTAQAAPAAAYAAPVSYPYPAVPAGTPVVRTIVKEVPEKDRRSRMAISTVHQAPKKGGAGGSYVWGTAGDVQDYDPAPVTESKVSIAPAQSITQAGPVSPFTANVASSQQFPALSSNTPSASPTIWHTQPAAIKEAPPAPAPAVPAASSPGLVPSPAPAATGPPAATGSPVLAPAPVPTPGPVTSLEAPEEAETKAKEGKEGSNCTSADTWLEAMPRQVCLTPGGRAGRKMHAALVAATLAMCLWQGSADLSSCSAGGQQIVIPEKSAFESMASVLSALVNLCTIGVMVYLVGKLSSMNFQAGPEATLREQVEMARQVSHPAKELGPNAYEVSTADGATSTVLQPKRGSVVIVKDSPDAVKAMKNVFMRLCTTTNEMISVNDVMKVHNLLGEPMDDEDEKKMMTFFDTQSKTKVCISFDSFMAWWNELHDVGADPDKYYSQERYRQRFKVLQSRLKEPTIASINSVTEGEVGSRRFRVWFESDGTRLSPWHDIPLRNPDGSYNFVCEIPKWTRKKYEIATGETMNPIKQDVKNGVLREYKWGDMLFNYGAFPQTWEDPKHVSEETGFPGDNDPIDVIELGTRQRPVGSITRVKILGVIAMIDDNETDWKVLTIAMDDDRSQNVNDLNDIDAHMPGCTQALTDWLRMYKTAEGKKENKFGCGGKPQGAAFARQVVDECHGAWRKLLAAADEKGKFRIFLAFCLDFPGSFPRVLRSVGVRAQEKVSQMLKLFYGPGAGMLPRPGDWFCGHCRARNCRDRWFCWRCAPAGSVGSPMTTPGTLRVLDSFSYPSKWDWGCTRCAAALCGYEHKCSYCGADRPCPNFPK
ncbi:Soluble inorganic pyrophosphatase 1, chloroplastic [Symbiodinium microadriaticum]|uniref:inorganic diphosphatase n=1 Tax=Symbiodinium microadriaticum TaxID=2951 RepID=A0A1Q9D3E0_SYMMI|nr:Soluble inorganic pyrophosphatase 1, chloroplastic [Symbiodinium microadriaticum]